MGAAATVSTTVGAAVTYGAAIVVDGMYMEAPGVAYIDVIVGAAAPKRGFYLLGRASVEKSRCAQDPSNQRHANITYTTVEA